MHHRTWTLAGALCVSLLSACDKPVQPCPTCPPPCPSAEPCPTPTPTPSATASTDEDGGPGACTKAGCLIGMGPCITAACITPPGGQTPICEYAATLAGACRCHPGDKRGCGTAGAPSTYKTCGLAGSSSSDTRWGPCQ